MERTLNSRATPTRVPTSDLNIHGRVDVDLRKTVEILRNNGVNVTVCSQEPPPINPTVVGKGKAAQGKRKQLTTPNVLVKGNGKALTIDPPSDAKENAFTHDFPTNKRQKTMGNRKEKKENEDSNEVVSISKYKTGQQRRRERERLEGRIRPLPLRGLVPTRKAIAQRRRKEIKRTGIDLQASSKQTNVDLVSLSTMGSETPDLTKQPNTRHLPLCDMIPIKNATAQGSRREIERNEIDLHAQSRQTKIKSIEIDLFASSKQANVDLVSLSTTDSETLDMTMQPNIFEITPLTTHSEQNNLQGQTQRSMLGRIPSPRNIAGELAENETAQVHPVTTPNACLMQEENMELLNMKLTKNETVQVHPATPPSVCLMQEENMELTKNETVQVHPATPPSVCLMQEENILISSPDLSTAISHHRQTYLQLFLILYLGRVTLGGSI